ncbi:hypothetical protein [Xenorhabdus griffiniae]|uniref:CdiI immunity protein domain-containing protein n=1 Tax=Xenorhabdus griffiniae TaxID=351672 RepID=A0ABY9XLE7_9GAMM|nr:hypothetical protein [Xenorhabdus griffiniae]MBD1228683.1 hypothetical protein [Xenorhabdus griffiniae]WMV73749.1 hypothetical protein QL128_07015 [Xenorhabdus griffiniae]WNH03430.1 hypothetical protein QL112_007020 [Xenorhabdus griffiniae]
MKNIGFHGGCTMVELGSSADMVEFFNLLNQGVDNIGEQKLLSQFYLRYLPFEDLDNMLSLIKNQDNFSGDLLQKFQKYFEGLEHCIISAKGFYEDFGTYSPVKVIVTDIPYCITEIDRSLEEYDALGANELPFWLRYEEN